MQSGCEHTALQVQVLQVFGQTGAFARQNDYSPRQGQIQMSLACTSAIERCGVLVVEAGTGVGKTFAYLVPALLNGKKSVISTATKALQDQLFERDLPALLSLLAIPAKVALLKGRSNYLCSYRLELARQEASLDTAKMAQALAQIERWALTTTSGDLAEIKNLDERTGILPWVTSTRENCLGSQCPQYRACYVNAARKKALASDIVIINHHLFFADLVVRESGMAELLPEVQSVIFDEAHQLNEIGVQFLGMQVTTGQLSDIARDALSAGLVYARGLVDWSLVASTLDKAAKNLRLCARNTPKNTKLMWNGVSPHSLKESLWQEALMQIIQALDYTKDALENVLPMAPDFVRLHERVVDLCQRMYRFLRPKDVQTVRWVEVGSQQMRLYESPLDIAMAVKNRMLMQPKVQPENYQALDDQVQSMPMDWSGFDEAIGNISNFVSDGQSADNLEGIGRGDNVYSQKEVEGEILKQFDKNMHTSLEPSAKAWIFTSATLGSDAQLTWFTKPCGLLESGRDVEILRVESPFDYEKQACCYVPSMRMLPTDAQHAVEVAQRTFEAVKILGGRTLVLTTTLRALKEIAQQLRNLVGSGDTQSTLTVLEQGSLPKRELISQFILLNSEKTNINKKDLLKNTPQKIEKGAVLVASASFWEGIDVAGEALQLVVIDKLPFPPPTDPLVMARSERLMQQGFSAFNAYSLPEACVMLKQGAGRLIRRESDRGALMICDARLNTKGYGKKIMNALPAMRLVTDESSWQDALKQLVVHRYM